MDNENEFNLNLDNLEVQAEEKLKVKNRFEKLSEKVILTSKERDELAKAKQDLETLNSNISKERDFYKDFSVNVSKYPQASEYQDKILEKVKSGYTTEDAMLAILAKEGKLNSPSQENKQPVRQVQAEGGSAPTSFEGNKSVSEMSASEKFAALSEIDKTGELGSVLRDLRSR